MGVEYMIACKDCKVTRSLDKFYIACWPCSSRLEAIKMADELAKGRYLFPSALLIGFLSDHRGHDVVFFTEHDDCAKELDPVNENGFSHDNKYWAP